MVGIDIHNTKLQEGRWLHVLLSFVSLFFSSQLYWYKCLYHFENALALGMKLEVIMYLKRWVVEVFPCLAGFRILEAALCNASLPEWVSQFSAFLLLVFTEGRSLKVTVGDEAAKLLWRTAMELIQFLPRIFYTILYYFVFYYNILFNPTWYPNTLQIYALRNKRCLLQWGGEGSLARLNLDQQKVNDSVGGW